MKKYIIRLDGKLIGHSYLVPEDPSMGVASGKIDFQSGIEPYSFFRAYCIEQSVEILMDFPEDQFIQTRIIPGLQVENPDGVTIESQHGNCIVGLGVENDFRIELLGVPHPFYAIEFQQSDES